MQARQGATTHLLASPHARGVTSQIFAVHGPTISRLPEWTPAGEITGPHALRLADVIEHRAGLGSPEECVIVDVAEALARSGRLGAV